MKIRLQKAPMLKIAVGVFSWSETPHSCVSRHFRSVEIVWFPF